MFTWPNNCENLSLEDSLSDSSERLLPRGNGRARGFRRFATTIKVIRTSKDYY